MGPSPMALGPYAFQALGFSFRGQSSDLATPWAELETTMRMDSLQWTGPKSSSFSIEGVIFDEAFGGQGSLDGIKGAAEAGRPLMLVTRAGRVHGMHVIFGVREQRDHIRFDGLARRNSYSIELRRYSGAGAGGIVGAVLSLF